MQDLPQEFVDLILDALKDDFKALKSCSLTCWCWHPRSSKHLFASYNLTTPSADSLARMSAIQSYERIRANVAVLTLRTRYMSTLSIIHALPHLRVFNIICSGMHPRMLEAFLSMPPPRPPSAGTVSHIRITEGTAGLVELVLRLFALVHTLTIIDLPLSPVNVHVLARHTIRALHLQCIHPDALQHISVMIEPTTLEDLSIFCPCQYERIDDTTYLDDFLRAVGSHLQSYHYVDSNPGAYYPYICES